MLKTLRQQLRQQRNNLKSTDQTQHSLCIYQQLLSLTVFQQAQSVALYYPTEGEPDLFSLLAQQKKQLLLPVVAKNQTLHFFPFHPEDSLQKNRYGILEPAAPQTNEVLPQEIDVILLPLVAFDDSGHRLGRGKGYYDRTLSFMREAPRPKKTLFNRHWLCLSKNFNSRTKTVGRSTQWSHHRK